jgi:hypothetical protein
MADPSVHPRKIFLGPCGGGSQRFWEEVFDKDDTKVGFVEGQ